MKIRGTKKMKAVLYIGLFLVWTGPILYSYDLGDVNHDSVRNIVDSLLIAQYYVGRPVEDIDLELADTDANGTINIVDSLLVAQLYIGVIDILPGELIATPTPIPGYPVNWYALQKAFPLSAKEEEKLIQNGFLVLRSPAMDTITEAYCDLADHIEVPSFITSDALLHIFHITYAHMLETVEIKFLISDLRTLLDMFNTGVKTEFDRCGSGTICKEAARQLWIFSAVADALINGRQTVQGEDVGIINADADVILKKIVDHTFTSSATGEDYTVYKPRGHYSGDPELEQYFRAMQWLRKKKITYSDGNDPLNDEYQFIAAVIMGYVISGRTEMYDLWNKIYTFIKKLSISKESITPVTVEQVMKNYYKTQYENEGYGILNDLEELALIQDELKEHDPDLLQYVQFLGEPYYLDNEIMEKTLSPHVPDRYLPNGLDIASTIFASQTAYELNGEEMSNYPGLSDKLDELSAQYGMRQEEEWKESFIDYWLYTLQSLSSSAEAYAPAFMSGDAWLKEKLNTQLSSWAELHSDNVNYEPTPSSIPTPEPTPVPTTAPEPVQIEYRCVNQTASVNQIRFNINIVNCSDITYDLGDIVVRYFYTKEGTSGEQVVFDYAVVGKEKIYGEFSGGYLQIAFLPEAGLLSPGRQTGEIQVRIFKNDWTAYTQTDDYSFDPDKTLYTVHRKITCHRGDGTLLWGDIPAGAVTPEPTDTAPPTTNPPTATDPPATGPPTVTNPPSVTVTPTEPPTLTPTPEPTPIPPPGFVEPYTGFYTRLKTMCDDLETYLRTLDTSLIHILKFHDIGIWAGEFGKDAATLASGEPLDEVDNQYINGWGTLVRNFFNQDTSFIPEQDSEAHVISDIYTYADKVLHAGVGRLLPVIIIYDVPGETDTTIAAAGYVLTYYELLEEEWNRLDDAVWKERLTTNPPPRPEWTADFMTE